VHFFRENIPPLHVSKVNITLFPHTDFTYKTLLLIQEQENDKFYFIPTKWQCSFKAEFEYIFWKIFSSFVEFVS